MRLKSTGKLKSTVTPNLTVAPIGAGGFITGVDQRANGELGISPDVVGVYIRKPGDKRFRSLVNAANVNVSQLYENTNLADSGGGAIRFAPSNDNIIYWMRGGWLHKSTDGGVTQSRCTGFGEKYYLPNTAMQRLHNRTLDVHPTNPNIVILGTNHYATDTSKSGVFYSTDGGASAGLKVSGIATPTARDGGPGRYFVHIDPGQPATAYAHVNGTGLYRCDTFPSQTGWTFISGSPLYCNQIEVLADGTVWIACGGSPGGGNTNDVYKRTRAGAATYFSTAAGSGAVCIAVYGTRIFTGDQDGNWSISFNGGTNWRGYDGSNEPNPQVGSGEIKWLSDKGVKSLVPAMLLFDKTGANKLWCANGFGLNWADAPLNSGDPLVWHDYTAGVEEKIARAFLSVAGKKEVIVTNWDMAVCVMNSITEYTNTPLAFPQPNGGNGLSIGSGIAAAQDDPNFVAVSIAQTVGGNVYSTDFGNSFKLMPNQGSDWPYLTASLDVNRKNNIIIMGGGNGKSYWTKTAGGTWTWAPVQLRPGTDTINLSANADICNTITADHMRAERFALVAPAGPDGGLWTTADGGVTWTQTITGHIGAGVAGLGVGNDTTMAGGTLRYVPGFSGELLWTPEHLYNTSFGGNFLFHLTDDGKGTRQRLGANVTSVQHFAFFPPLVPGGRPPVAFYGKVNGVRGLYLSEDWFATDPILIAEIPLENLSGCGFVGCDQNNYGRIYAGRVGWTYASLGQRLKVRAS